MPKTNMLLRLPVRQPRKYSSSSFNEILVLYKERVMIAQIERTCSHGRTISYFGGVAGGEIFEPVNCHLS